MNDLELSSCFGIDGNTVGLACLFITHVSIDDVMQFLVTGASAVQIGTANYYDIVIDGETNSGAAWYYVAPKPEAANIKDHVAFWKGVTVES